MSRAPRNEHPGALYHVTSRAIDTEPLFADDRDRARFLGLLGEVTRAHSWRCHAYCLMDTHVHLVIGTPEPNLGVGMRWLKTRYAATYNKRHGRRGHLFDGRYYAVLVRDESHATSTFVYVALNPVRAALATHPADWPWSSYRATAGLAPPLALLDVDGALRLVVGSAPGAARRYADIVEGALSGEDR